MIRFETWENDPITALSEMGAGNPGAMQVAAALHGYKPETARGILALMNADDLGIRGGQLWVAYKDYCGKDLDVLCERLVKRDMGLTLPFNG